MITLGDIKIWRQKRNIVSLKVSIMRNKRVVGEQSSPTKDLPSFLTGTKITIVSKANTCKFVFGKMNLELAMACAIMRFDKLENAS